MEESTVLPLTGDSLRSVAYFSDIKDVYTLARTCKYYYGLLWSELKKKELGCFKAAKEMSFVFPLLMAPCYTENPSLLREKIYPSFIYISKYADARKNLYKSTHTTYKYINIFCSEIPEKRLNSLITGNKLSGDVDKGMRSVFSQDEAITEYWSIFWHVYYEHLLFEHAYLAMSRLDLINSINYSVVMYLR